MSRGGRRAGRPDDGAAVVEFALILPVLSLVLFGVIQYSMYFWSTQSAADAAREGARRGAVGQTCTELRANTAALVRLAQATPTVTRRYYAPSDTSYATPLTLAPSNATNASVRIEIRYRTPDLNIPFVPFPDNGQVVEVAVARVESYSSAAPGRWASCT